MECKKCKTECSSKANFCENCGSKLKETCDCWIKKEPYNCGEEKCPAVIGSLKGGNNVVDYKKYYLMGVQMGFSVAALMVAIISLIAELKRL